MRRRKRGANGFKAESRVTAAHEYLRFTAGGFPSNPILFGSVPNNWNLIPSAKCL
jgi:hypothetical protein